MYFVTCISNSESERIGGFYHQVDRRLMCPCNGKREHFNVMGQRLELVLAVDG